jgi:hypothetical protein
MPDRNHFLRDFLFPFFMVAGMKKSLRLPNGEEQAILDRVRVRLIERAELEKFNRLLDEHHYLGSQQAVGERLQYVATDREGEWLALLVFSAAAKHLKHRDQWIGWNSAPGSLRSGLGGNFVARQTLQRLPGFFW